MSDVIIIIDLVQKFMKDYTVLAKNGKNIIILCWIPSPLSILGEKKLSLQYCLKLSSNYNNPAYATVFNSKFQSVFERKPTQLPPLAIRVSSDLQTVGFKKSDVIISSIPTTPPWLLTRPAVNFTLLGQKQHSSRNIQTSFL